MIPVSSEHVSPSIRALFNADMPAGLRCMGVLEGSTVGTVFTDNIEHPTWAVVRDAFGTLYPAGAVDKEILTALVHELRQTGEVLIGFWPDDPLVKALPDAPDYEGSVLDCTHRLLGQGLDSFLKAIPVGCEVRRMDAELFQRSVWHDDRLKTHGSLDEIVKKEIGYCLLRGDVIASEATAGPLAKGFVEMGTITDEAYRGRGYATVVCAHLIQECETWGLQTYWNCNTQNLPSMALARKLGYRTIREYRLVAWFPPRAD